MKLAAVLVALVAVQAATAKIYFQEEFDSEWRSRWVDSTKKGDGQGKIEWSAGELNAGTDAEKGMVLSQDMKHYHTTAVFPEFSNKDKTLVFQYQAKLPKKFECGGAYLKLHPKGIDQANYDGDSKYNIMFGPDHCGYSTKKIHLIFNYKDKNVEKKSEIKIEYDEKNEYSHVYTLILKPDNTYEVQFDGKKKASGKLEEDWELLEPKEIDDPEDKKPSDWVEEAKIKDPEEKKPEGWDDIPKQIQDPDAKKPEEWDDEDDGEWEVPLIPNPAYKGEWKPKMIDNPAYKGVWKAKRIPNPKYSEDKDLYLYESIAAVGVEVWNVNAGLHYDNIIVTDSEEEAKAFRERTFGPVQTAEKKLKDDKEAAEKKKAEEDKKKAEEAKTDKKDDDDDDDDEDKSKKKEEL